MPLLKLTDNNSNYHTQVLKEERKMYLLDQERRQKASVVLTPKPLQPPRVMPQDRKFSLPPLELLSVDEEQENIQMSQVENDLENDLVHQLENMVPQKSRSLVASQLRQLAQKNQAQKKVLSLPIISGMVVSLEASA